MSFVQDLLKKGWKVSWTWEFGGERRKKDRESREEVEKPEIPGKEKKYDPTDNLGMMG